ncbi:MAG: endonuclease MutS2, partial [Clostridia bacterium]|nr:endonuclease MutS2 [Clostridia bacterium]
MGTPGSSNAIKIAKRLGLNEEIISHALNSLSPDKVKFEKIIESAESIRRIASLELEETEKIKEDLLTQKRQLEIKTKQVDEMMAKIKSNAQAEAKRLVSNSLEKANEI